MLLATWFGVGLLPRMPGTWGSLAALPLGWAIASLSGPAGLAAAAAALFVVGCCAAATVAKAARVKDPAVIVIDEVAAQSLTLAFAAPAPLPYALAFLFFRLFDIWKPWPVRWADRAVGGGLGIMLDDILAAVYAVLAMLVIERVAGVRG